MEKRPYRSPSPPSNYEMRHIPQHSSPPLRLTRENLRMFEEEQERVAREKRAKTPPVPRLGPSPTKFTQMDQQPQLQQQVFVLDRVVEMDEIKNGDHKYKCCCRCTNVYRGAWWVGFMEAIIGLVALIAVIVNYAHLGQTRK